MATAQADSAKADTSEILEAKAAPADTAKADTAVTVATDTAAVAKTDSAKAAPVAEEKSEARTAGQTIMENPLEFIIVSAAFIASVLVIIFTGKD